MFLPIMIRFCLKSKSYLRKTLILEWLGSERKSSCLSSRRPSPLNIINNPLWRYQKAAGKILSTRKYARLYLDCAALEIYRSLTIFLLILISSPPLIHTIHLPRQKLTINAKRPTFSRTGDGIMVFVL